MSLVVLAQALIDSIKRGDVEAVAALLEAGADANAVDLYDGLSALRHASDGGHVRIARLLRERGATPLEAPPAAVVEPPERPEEAKCSPGRPDLPSWVMPLMECYFADGYVCRPCDPAAGSDGDWEVRFLCAGKRHVEYVQGLLARAGWACGEPKRRPRGWMQAVSGRKAVEQLLAWWSQAREWVVPKPDAPVSPGPSAAEQVKDVSFGMRYKLRRKSDGLYADGDEAGEKWSAEGKEWDDLAGLGSYLTAVGLDKGALTATALEIVTFELRGKPVLTTPFALRRDQSGRISVVIGESP